MLLSSLLSDVRAPCSLLRAGRACALRGRRLLTRSVSAASQASSDPLLARLSSALGPEDASSELRWMCEALEQEGLTGTPLAPGRLEAMVADRVAGKPLQYILGTQPFGPLLLRVRPPTLIPRPETEQWTLDLASNLSSLPQTPLRILDLFTGSGCVGLLLAHFLPHARCTLVDLSRSSCSLARENASQSNVSDRVSVVQRDVLRPDFAEELAHGPDAGEGWDVITANPPYVTEEEYAGLSPEVRDWEDVGALVGGLRFYHRLAEIAPQLLRPSGPGRLVMEVGRGQAPDVSRIMRQSPAAPNVESWVDPYGDFDRVVCATFEPHGQRRNYSTLSASARHLASPLLSPLAFLSHWARPPLLPSLMSSFSRPATSASSNRYLARQKRDPYRTGLTSFRSRAAPKLQQLDAAYRFLSPSRVVVDLGAAPGGWLEIAAPRSRKVVGVDLLPIQPVPGAEVVQGDFLDPRVRARVCALLGQDKVDVVLSDMAPSISGNKIRDEEASLELCEAALDFAVQNLRVDRRPDPEPSIDPTLDALSPDASKKKSSKRRAGSSSVLIIKHFASTGATKFRKERLMPRFDRVLYEKPEASRKESGEGYFVCIGFRGAPESA